MVPNILHSLQDIVYDFIRRRENLFSVYKTSIYLLLFVNCVRVLALVAY